MSAVDRPAGGRSLWVLAVAAGLGVLAGAVVGPPMEAVSIVGEVFLRALQMIVVPLLLASVVTGIASLGQTMGVGRAARVAVLYLLGTTLLSVLLGIAVVTWIAPGEGLGLEIPGQVPERLQGLASRTPLETLETLLRSFVSPQAFAAMAGDPPAILAVITFSILLGAALGTLGERARPALDAFAAMDAAMIRVVRYVMAVAPVGIFALVAARLGAAGGGMATWQALVPIGAYVATVLLGLSLHAFGTLPLLLRWLGRRPPAAFARGMGPAFLMAFSTASSAATLPLTMDCLRTRNGVSARTVRFVAPLGATLNMNGTALYEAVAVVFIAQGYGLSLGPAELLVVAVTATLAAIGASAIPEAGLVTMVMVLSAVGLPAEGIAWLLPVDWILDRCRTTVNVWDDGVGAAVVERLADLGDPPPEKP